MFQLNKKTIIFLSIFTIVAIGITAGAIYYTKTNKSNDSTTVIIEKQDNSNNQNNKQIVDDNVSGLKLDDKFKINDLIISDVEFSDGAVVDIEANIKKLQVSYIKISGLKNEAIQDKINNEVKEKIFSLYTEEELKDQKVENIYINAFLIGNFSDVVSIEIEKYKILKDSDSITELYGLNYSLATGEQIKFDDLFTYNTGKKNILSHCIYNDLSWNYFTDNNYTEGVLDFNKVNYQDLEDKVLKYILEYNKGNYQFFFSTNSIYINIDNNLIEIPMIDYYENIAIYNRFKSNENLYTTPPKYENEFPVLTMRSFDYYKENWHGYELYEEVNDYLTIEFDINNLDDEVINDKIRENYQKEIENIIKSIKDESSKNSNLAYYYAGTAYGANEENGIVTLTLTVRKYTSTRATYKKYVYEEILNQRRHPNEASMNLYYENLNETYVAVEEKEYEKKYDLNTGEEYKEPVVEEIPIETIPTYENEINNNTQTEYNDINNTVTNSTQGTNSVDNNIVTENVVENNLFTVTVE